MVAVGALGRATLASMEVNMVTKKSLTVGDILSCTKCMIYYQAQPMLIAACASVGISRGKSTRQMMLGFLASYHQRGHRDLDRSVDV